MIRKKIKLVTGVVHQAALLNVWDVVAANHDVEVLRLEGGDMKSEINLPSVIFPSIDEMPGYYRDLDAYLKGADIVVGFETSKLYSFQALRSARKLGIPFVCVAHEYTPFVYDKYANIRAIQFDIHQNADLFLSSSHKATQLLQIENVAEEKIVNFKMMLDSNSPGFLKTAREKFRKYVGISDQSIVLNIFAKLDEKEQALTAIQGVRLFMNRISPKDRDDIRILICGSGEANSDLKYQIADMGLGSKTMFLSQDISPFLYDLLAATDVLIDCKQLKNETSYLPWHLLSAAASGVRILLVNGGVESDWLPKEVGVRIDSFSHLDIVAGLLAIYAQSSFSIEGRVELAESYKAKFDLHEAANIFCGAVKRLCNKDEKSNRRESLRHFIEQNQIPISYKNAKDTLVHCEEVKDFSSTLDSDLHSEVLRIRGDALVALNRTEEAVSAFEASLKVNSTNHHALRGLGYLAWQGYSHEDALSFFKRGLGVNPNDYQCLVGVGLVYRRLKMFDEAVYWLKSAVAVGGFETPSLGLLVQACLENAEEPKALEVLTMIKESFGDHPILTTAIQKLESHR